MAVDALSSDQSMSEAWTASRRFLTFHIVPQVTLIPRSPGKCLRIQTVSDTIGKTLAAYKLIYFAITWLKHFHL